LFGGSSFSNADLGGFNRGENGDLSSAISLRSAATTAACSSSLRDFHSVYLVERFPAQSYARYHSYGGDPNLYGFAAAFVLDYRSILRRCTVVNLPIGSACTVKPLYRYCVSHTAPPPVLRERIVGACMRQGRPYGRVLASLDKEMGHVAGEAGLSAA
jgi:hypothetical protein